MSYKLSDEQVEQHAERRALAVMRSASFTECLRTFDLAPMMDVLDSKGRRVRVRGSDLCDRRTWRKYLTATKQTTEALRLNGQVDTLTESYIVWLLHDFTPRYRFLAESEALDWLRQVARLAVVRFVMVQKYEAYVIRGQDTFADPYVAQEMTVMMACHDLQRELPRIVHHLIKDSEAAEALLQHFWEGYETLLRTWEQVKGRRTLPPPLPAGTPLPLAWLERPDSEREMPEEQRGGEGLDGRPSTDTV